jgi:hypothetical protein
MSLKDGKLQIEDVQGPTGEGSLEARMEVLEQEVFKYKKMAEREVDIDAARCVDVNHRPVGNPKRKV